MKFQVVKTFAGEVHCFYADTPELASKIVSLLLTRGPKGIQQNNNRLHLEIRQEGDFVPDPE